MNTVTKTVSLMALCCAVWGPAEAQQQAAPPTPTPSAAASAASSGAQAAATAKGARPTAQSEAGEPQVDTSNQTPSNAPATSPAPPNPRTPAAGPPAAQKSAPKTDRLELGTATVTGDREQPKVMYVVPWKRSDIGDLSGKPMNSLVDEILAPVDRDVFKREVVYYNAVQADPSQNGAAPKPAPQGEK
jgi:hypothetical protein